MRSYVHAGVSVLASYGAGFAGSLFMSSDAIRWYEGLSKPFFTPPMWVFGVVWIILYGLIAAALALMWKHDPDAKDGTGWVPLFFAHLLLNAAWTMFFFGFHSLFIAFIDAILLFWCAILLWCGAINTNRLAARLLVPYILWLAFATLLSGAFWYLN